MVKTYATKRNSRGKFLFFKNPYKGSPITIGARPNTRKDQTDEWPTNAGCGFIMTWSNKQVNTTSVNTPWVPQMYNLYGQYSILFAVFF